LIKRKGLDPVRHTFGMEDAKTAGLLGKSGPWTNYPRRMRQMRARGYALRDAFPDILMGLSIVEEVQDIGGERGTVTDAVLTRELTPEQEERITKAFEALNLGEAQRRVFTMKHLSVTDRPLAESVEALLNDLKDEFAKRKTGRPARRLKPAPADESPAEAPAPTPSPSEQAESFVAALDPAPDKAEEAAIDAAAATSKPTGKFAF
jgi:hypothetical protein